MKVTDAYPWASEAFSVIREEAGGKYLVCDCPVRNHENSRLRLWLGTDGRLMFGCYACGPGMKSEILRAARLSWADCFPAGTQIERVHQEVTARYYYRDRNGVPVARKLRLEPGRNGRSKEFAVYKPNPAFDRSRPYGPDNRKWVKPGSLSEVERVLYRLPELRRADPSRPVFVVEGEKDADNLAALGLVVTCNIGGASEEWPESYTEELAGRHVVIAEDADEPGRRHANEVLGAVVRVAKSASVVRLPAKDATAFLIETRRRLEGESFGADVGDDELREEFRLAVQRGATYRAATAGECWQDL